MRKDKVITERYRFYREHKFVIAFVNDTSRMIATSNFTEANELKKIKKRIENLIMLLSGHAEHEENCYHTLLKDKNSTVYLDIESDHKIHADYFETWRNCLDEIESAESSSEKNAKGYQFYLAFRKFEQDNLRHLNDEETIIMPELQRLYSDESLKEIEHTVYKKKEMTPAAFINMLSTLFPYMNWDDKLTFLHDLHLASPEKFMPVIANIQSLFDRATYQKLLDHFQLNLISLEKFKFEATPLT